MKEAKMLQIKIPHIEIRKNNGADNENAFYSILFYMKHVFILTQVTIPVIKVAKKNKVGER
jgi:hypothetical protein